MKRRMLTMGLAGALAGGLGCALRAGAQPNPKTAKALGLTLPKSLLLRAGEVTE